MVKLKDKFKNKPTGLISASDFKTVSGKVIYILFTVILLIACIISVLPAVWTLLTAFKDTQEIYSTFSFFPKDLSFAKIANRLSESWSILQLGDSFVNTIVLSAGNLVFKVVVCGFGGYVLSRLKPKGTKLVFMLVVWTMMMPTQIRMVPNYISWLHFPFASGNAGVSLLDTYWPMWLGAGADTFTVLLFKNSFDALSISYVEAAKIDGCSDIQLFFRIVLPMLKPTTATICITNILWVWNDFLLPLIVLSDSKKYTLLISTNTLFGQYSSDWAAILSALILAALPAVILYIAFQKQIIGGITDGAVKG